MEGGFISFKCVRTTHIWQISANASKEWCTKASLYEYIRGHLWIRGEYVLIRQLTRILANVMQMLQKCVMYWFYFWIPSKRRLAGSRKLSYCLCANSWKNWDSKPILSLNIESVSVRVICFGEKSLKMPSCAWIWVWMYVHHWAREEIVLFFSCEPIQ